MISNNVKSGTPSGLSNVTELAKTFSELGPDDSLGTADIYRGKFTSSSDVAKKTSGDKITGNEALDNAVKTLLPTNKKTNELLASVVKGSEDRDYAAVAAAVAGYKLNNDQSTRLSSATNGTVGSLTNSDKSFIMSFLSDPSNWRSEAGKININEKVGVIPMIKTDTYTGTLSAYPGEPPTYDPTTLPLNAVRWNEDDVVVTSVLLTAEQFANGEDLADILSNMNRDPNVSVALKDHLTAIAVCDVALNRLIASGTYDVIVKTINSILDAETLATTAAKNMLLSKLLPAAKKANLGAILAILTYTGSEAAIAYDDELAISILKYYKIPTGTASDQYTVVRDALLTTLSAYDAHWFEKDRNGTWTSDLAPFRTASDDATTLMKLSTYFVEIMIAKSWSKANIKSLALTQYPYASMS